MNLFFSDPIAPIFLVGPLLALLVLVNARRLGEALGIMDHPDTNRKRHVQPTPLVCGLAIVVPLFLWAGGSLLLGHGVNQQLVLAILLCGAGSTLVGFTDDQSPTSPSSRLLFLFLLSSIALVIEPDLLPTQLSWGTFYTLPLAPWFAFAFVVVAMSGFVNAVNMADGQDGIAIGMFVIWFVCLIIHTGGSTQGASLVLLETALIAFIFNITGRAFLGDSGAYGVSFVIGLLAIRAHNRWGVPAETITVWFFIPVMDCLRLIVARALKRQTPFGSGRDHFHHRLEERVGKTYGLALYLAVIGATSIIATLIPSLSFICLIALAAFYFSFVRRGAESGAKNFALGDAGDGGFDRLVDNDNVVLITAKKAASEDLRIATR